MLDDAPSALQLAVFAGESVQTIPLPPSGSLSIGRAPDSDVRIDHASVSRRHAVLHVGPPLVIEDLGGSNGTFVRDPRAPETEGETADLQQVSRASVEIRPGDTINVGAVALVVRRVPSRPPGDTGARGTAVVVASPAMRALWAEAQLAAQSAISVLILGETGVGKEVLARAVHEASARASRPFLGLNCGALPESLLEGELFGHEKGAFTGAAQARPGLFESADGGTVFLDEVGELPAAIQVKLLRVLELREVLRIGARAPRRIDVRFIAATNRDLEAEAARGTFRQDLFFRLEGIILTIPPLRERADEIPELARTFLAAACAAMDRPRVPALSAEALAALQRWTWPGNVRELRNVMDRAAVLCADGRVEPHHFPPRIRDAVAVAAPPQTSSAPPAAPPAQGGSAGLAAAQRERIVAALEACAGNQTQAATMLGISRRTLINRIEELGLPRPKKKA